MVLLRGAMYNSNSMLYIQCSQASGSCKGAIACSIHDMYDMYDDIYDMYDDMWAKSPQFGRSTSGIACHLRVVILRNHKPFAEWSIKNM